MCGIAVLRTHSLEMGEYIHFSRALITNESRGGDSVGVMVYPGTDSPVFLSHTFHAEATPVLASVVEKIQEKGLWGKPCILLGHTRLAATGSKKDFHPALAGKTKRWAIVHNGVVEHKKISPKENDTYGWAALLDSADTPHLDVNVEASSSAAFLLDRLTGTLYMGIVGTTPLYEVKLKTGGMLWSSVEYSSIPPKGKEVKANTFWKLEWGSKKPKPVDAFITVKKQSVLSSRYPYGRLYPSYRDYDYGEWDFRVKTPYFTEEDSELRVVDIYYYTGVNARYCDWCDKSLPSYNSGMSPVYPVRLLSDGTYVCQECWKTYMSSYVTGKANSERPFRMGRRR